MSLNLTVPKLSASLEKELAMLSSDFIHYRPGYGIETRMEATIQAHFFRLGLECNNLSYRHYFPRNTKDDEHIRNLIIRYRVEILDELGLSIIIQGRTLFVHTADHVLAIGELTGTNPAFRILRWIGHSELVQLLDTRMNEDGTNRIPVMNRIFSNDKYVMDTPITLPDFTAPVRQDLVYPFLDQTAAELWDAFSASASNVMILIGPPGTGKSSLIRAMLDHRGWDDNAYLADSTTTIMHPGFVEHIRNLPRGSIVVTEDSDPLLESRDNGNMAMATLLNATSGVASTDTKFLIGTNLASLNKSDDAILRRGRLFKVLSFRTLTLEEAIAARASMGKPEVDLSVLGDSISLADALNYGLENEVKSEPIKRAVGFI